MSRQQLKRWVGALSEGICQGFGGPGLCLAIQAQLPAQVPAVPPGAMPQQSTPALGGASLSGVHA